MGGREGRAGFEEAPAPFLDRIAERGAVMLCEDERGPFVLAHPGGEDRLWTLPFDDGGEARGFLDERLRECGYLGFVVSNDAICHVCGQIVSSAWARDVRTCGCGNVSVDGGHEHAVRSFKSERFDDLSVAGWAAEERWLETVSALSSCRKSMQSAQAALSLRDEPRFFEVEGILRDTGEPLSARETGHARFDAARRVRARFPDMDVTAIRQAMLPEHVKALLRELPALTAAGEDHLLRLLGDWEDLTEDVLGFLGSARASPVLADCLGRRLSALEAKRRSIETRG